MRIYIRHAEKEYKNGHTNSYKHDPSITPTGRDSIKDLVTFLVSTWGYPNTIICSPYRRARETVDNMLLSLQSTIPINTIQLYCDCSLSEYLGNWKHDKLDVYPDTQIFNPPHPEMFCQFRNRLRRHNEYFIQQEEKNDTNVTWFVTHGLVISQLVNINHFYLKGPLPYLGVIALFKHKNMNRCQLSIMNDPKCIQYIPIQRQYLSKIKQFDSSRNITIPA